MLKKIMIFLLVIISSYSLFSQENLYMSVTVKSTQTREKPSFLGKTLYVLNYTDRVQILENSNGWVNVLVPNNKDTGWVHISTLTKKTLVLKQNTKKLNNVSKSEVALAGKGFNSNLEDTFKSEKNLDYTWIDKMEEMELSFEEVIQFVEE